MSEDLIGSEMKGTRRQFFRAVVALGFLAGVPVAGQTKRSDVEHDGFKGRVRTVLVESAKLSNKNGKLTEGRRKFHSKWSYDSRGVLVEEEIKGSRRLYRYDTDGNRYEKRSSSWMAGPPSTEDFRNQQDRAADGSWLFKWVCKHDSDGNRIEETIYSGAREPHSRFSYRYDDKGRRAEVSHEAQGSTTKRFTYAYNEAGQIRERLEFSGSDTVAGRRQQDFEFDSSGNWVKSTTFASRKKAGKKQFEPVEVSYRTITYY
jgi:hypothetical protein